MWSINRTGQDIKNTPDYHPPIFTKNKQKDTKTKQTNQQQGV